MLKNKKNIKNYSLILSSLLLTSGVATSVNAASEEPSQVMAHHNFIDQLPKKNVISTIQKYLYLNPDGTIAINKRIPSDIAEKYKINKLKERFLDVNKRVNNGEIIINSDLSITDKKTFNILAKSSQVERHEEYWWGHKNWYNNRQTKEAIDALNTAAASAGIAAGLSSLGFPPGAFAGGVAAGYWMLLATRMGANNNGLGVTVSMTWALVYDVESR
ncbi:hypothetical protein [Bacillus cereus]